MGEKVKRVAIIFTDVEGYTSMMQKDEEGTIDLVRKVQSAQQKEITKSGGHIVKELGDGLLAYFNDPDIAIRCMVQVQRIVSQNFEIRLRVGIHLADVVFSENDILGDGVNIASRIEPLADPGGVFVSEEMRNNVDLNEFKLKPLGKARLKGVKEKVNIYAVIDESLPEPSQTRFNRLANPKKKLEAIPTAIVFLVIVLAASLSTRYFKQKAEISKAEASVIQLSQLVNSEWRDYSDEFIMAKEVEKVIPEDKDLQKLLSRSSVRINITTDPPNADVYYKLYTKPESEWKYLGKTPINEAQLPKCAIRWKIEKEGYMATLAASQSTKFGRLTADSLLIGQDFHRRLIKEEDSKGDMVYIPGADLGYGTIPGFFIDRFEVTNKEYYEFVRQGGYEKDEYWVTLLDHMKDSAEYKAIRSTFVDITGLAGPSTWENGTYKDGQENYPVSGVNWYEALAYAQFIGKEIPTKDHWGLAYGINLTIVQAHQIGGSALFAPFRNFQRDGAREIGRPPGIDPYGTYDMGGNVREWCWNSSNLGRWMRGGSYNDNPYMGINASQAEPLDRSAINGFRCVSYLNRDDIPSEAFTQKTTKHRIHITGVPEPISDEGFSIIKNLYNYDQTSVNGKIESRKERKNWVLEKVTFDAAYEDQKITAYVFLPKDVAPPFQTVIYGYGSGAFTGPSSMDIENYYEFPAFVEYIVGSGRAVIMPIVNGTFERTDQNSFKIHQRFGSHNFTPFMIKIVKDYRRTIDYLETRGSDFDMERLCFYGMSYGPLIGQFLSAVDDRVKTNIFYAGGTTVGIPESNPINFLPRITIPTLMINGKYDANFRVDHEIKYMYEFLGTPDEHKKLLLYNSDHLAPKSDVVKETLFWLNDQFGTVNYGRFASVN